MISWIQTTFQKHTKFFIFFLLVAVTIPFVFTIGNPGIGRADHKVLEQPFFGYNLGNDEQARRIFRDGSFSAQLKGAFQASGPQLQEYSLSRIAGLALADQLGLPVPSEQEVSAHIAALPAFRNEQGGFDQQLYQQFADSLKTSRDFTTADANRVFRDDTRLAALSKVIAGPGYVLPSDVADQLKRADATWTLAIASLDYATFDPGLSPTDEVLQKYHADNPLRYEIPARPRLSTVAFPFADYIPAVAPSEAEARAFYAANAPRFPVPPEENQKEPGTPSFALGENATTAPDNFLKVRAQVEAAMKQEVARRAASRAANDFTVALFESKAPANSTALEQFLATQRRQAQPIAPFSLDNPPADRAWLANYAEQIARLGADRFFSDPLPAPDGYQVLLWQESLPAYQPLFAEVRAKVLSDYLESEKRRRFIERGQQLRASLQAAVQSGQSFTAAAEAQKLEVKTYAAFSLRQPPQDLPYAAYSAMQNLEAGQTSEMIAAADKGHFVHAVVKSVPDTSASNPRFAEVRQQLMQYTASANESALLGALVEAELRKSAPPRTAQP